MVLFVLAACSGSEPSALERARTTGLSAGFAVEAPYAFVDSTGYVTGEAPEILREVAAEVGIPHIQWYPLDFQELIPALTAGRIDVIAAGMFITPERAARVRFSHPTACVRPVLVTQAAARDVPAPASGGCRGCRIAVVSGSVEQEVLEREGRPQVEPFAVPDPLTGITMVRNGTADALAISAPTARVLAEAPDLSARRRLPPELADAAAGCAAFAFRTEDEELAAAIDSALYGFLGTPRHREAAERFGLERDELACPPSSSAPGADRAGCTLPDESPPSTSGR